MKVEALILMRGRTVHRADIPLEQFALYDLKLYHLTPSNVATKIDGEKGARSPEVILWEGAPDPVGLPDESAALAEKVLAINLIENVTEKTKPSRFNKWWIIVPLALIAVAGGAYGLYSMGYLDALLKAW